MRKNLTISIMLFVLGLVLIAFGIGFFTATEMEARPRVVNGYVVMYQVAMHTLVDGVFLVPTGLILLVAAFIMTRVTIQPATPAERKRAAVGFALSLLSGAMCFLLGVSFWETSVTYRGGGGPLSFSFGPVAPFWLPGANTGTLGAIAAVSALIVIIGAILIYTPGKEIIGGILVIIFSVTGFIALGASLILNIFGIIGGALVLSKASMKAVAARTQTFTVNRKQLVAVLLLITILVATVFWASQRLDMHKRWASQVIATEPVMMHFYRASQLLNNSSFETNQIVQEWFLGEIGYAGDSVSDLRMLDAEHKDQLFQIISMAFDLSRGTYVRSLSVAGRSTLAESLNNIGGKVGIAYNNLADYTTADRYTGPAFSYFGPSPPDEIILQQAVELANSIDMKIHATKT